MTYHLPPIPPGEAILTEDYDNNRVSVRFDPPDCVDVTVDRRILADLVAMENDRRWTHERIAELEKGDG